MVDFPSSGNRTRVVATAVATPRSTQPWFFRRPAAWMRMDARLGGQRMVEPRWLAPGRLVDDSQLVG